MALQKVKVNAELMAAAKAQVEAQKVNNPSIRIGGNIEGLEKKIVGDLLVNMWTIGDTITFPEKIEDFDQYLVYETYPNLPLNQDGSVKDGYYMLVTVQNGDTQTIKHFRPGAITASFPEYKRDEASGCFIATGTTCQSNTPLAQVLRTKANQRQQYEYLIGKTIKVTSQVTGKAAKSQGGVVVDLKSRTISNFEVVDAE